MKKNTSSFHRSCITNRSVLACVTVSRDVPANFLRVSYRANMSLFDRIHDIERFQATLTTCSPSPNPLISCPSCLLLRFLGNMKRMLLKTYSDKRWDFSLSGVSEKIVVDKTEFINDEKRQLEFDNRNPQFWEVIIGLVLHKDTETINREDTNTQQGTQIYE